METAAATAALEGRYAVLLGSAGSLSSDELLDVIEVAQREKDAASARQAVALAHLSALDSHAQEDGTQAEVHHGLGYQRLDGPELVAPRLGVSVHVASNRILDAVRQMTRTPVVVDAMASGELDEHRARVVTEETEFLSPESATAVVDVVKDHWQHLTTGPLRRLLVRAAAQVDPDAVTAHAEEERARRGLIRRLGEHGTDHWRGDFRVEQARGAWAAVTERARQLVREGKADSLEVARSDAMMELILDHSDVRVVVHTTRAAEDGTTNPGTDKTMTATTTDPAAMSACPVEAGVAGAEDRVEDLVEVGGLGAPGTTFVPRDWIDAAGGADPERDLTCDTHTGALIGGDVPASLARGQDAARRAHRVRERARDDATACSAGGDEQRVTTDFSDAYRVPDPMARLVRLRDGSCRFPSCAVPARQCDLDHVRAWPTGPTTPTNLIALCRRHHRIKQRPGWTVHLHPDATLTWTDPTGHVSTTWPVDHLHLITAGHTHRVTGAPTAHHTAAEIPTSFEEALTDLLGGTHHAMPRAHPTWFDLDGTTYGGPPPRTDLDHHPAWGRYHLDFPPRPPRAAERIPF